MGRQGDAQLCNIRRRHAGDAAGLAQVLGPDAGQLLAGFQRQTGEVRVFKILRDQGLFVVSSRSASMGVIPSPQPMTPATRS